MILPFLWICSMTRSSSLSMGKFVIGVMMMEVTKIHQGPFVTMQQTLLDTMPFTWIPKLLVHRLYPQRGGLGRQRWQDQLPQHQHQHETTVNTYAPRRQLSEYRSWNTTTTSSSGSATTMTTSSNTTKTVLTHTIPDDKDDETIGHQRSIQITKDARYIATSPGGKGPLLFESRLLSSSSSSSSSRFVALGLPPPLESMDVLSISTLDDDTTNTSISDNYNMNHTNNHEEQEKEDDLIGLSWKSVRTPALCVFKFQSDFLVPRSCRSPTQIERRMWNVTNQENNSLTIVVTPRIQVGQGWIVILSRKHSRIPHHSRPCSSNDTLMTNDTTTNKYEGDDDDDDDGPSSIITVETYNRSTGMLHAEIQFWEDPSDLNVAYYSDITIIEADKPTNEQSSLLSSPDIAVSTVWRNGTIGITIMNLMTRNLKQTIILSTQEDEDNANENFTLTASVSTLVFMSLNTTTTRQPVYWLYSLVQPQSKLYIYSSDTKSIFPLSLTLPNGFKIQHMVLDDKLAYLVFAGREFQNQTTTLRWIAFDILSNPTTPLFHATGTVNGTYWIDVVARYGRIVYSTIETASSSSSSSSLMSSIITLTIPKQTMNETIQNKVNSSIDALPWKKSNDFDHYDPIPGGTPNISYNMLPLSQSSSLQGSINSTNVQKNDNEKNQSTESNPDRYPPHMTRTIFMGVVWLGWMIIVLSS
jgi:hypothetical protein